MWSFQNRLVVPERSQLPHVELASDPLRLLRAALGHALGAHTNLVPFSGTLDVERAVTAIIWLVHSGYVRDGREALDRVHPGDHRVSLPALEKRSSVWPRGCLKDGRLSARRLRALAQI
jgi:hypothetical protein